MIFQSAFGYEIKGEFQNRGEIAQVVEGEPFDAYIRIWPLQNEDLELIKTKLESNTFLDFFHIAKVYNIKYSENNEEVVEIYVKAILVNYYVPRQFYIWAYKSLTIPFEIQNLTPVKNPNGKNYIIQKQKVNPFETSSPYYKIIILLSIVLLMVAVFAGRVFYQKRNVKLKHKEIELSWNELFSSAQSRNDFEQIYTKKDEWLEFIGGETPPILHFLTTINSIQYKKDWTEFEELQVRDAFDEIRSIFEGN
jgi:hypothetical protein